MSKPRAVTVESFQIDDAHWKLLVTASCISVLNARDDKLPKSKRLAVETYSGDQAVANAATAYRSSSSSRYGPACHAEFISWVRDRVVSSDDAAACFNATIASCQDEWLQLVVDPSDTRPPCCCFTGATDDLFEVTLFGNRGPEGRTESVHVVQSVGWSDFVKALMVVGALVEWMDQLVLSFIPLTMRTIAPDEVDTLATKTLRQFHMGYNGAVEFVYNFTLAHP